MFKITSVYTTKLDKGTNLVGLAMVVIDDAFAIEDIRIVKGKERMFVAFPSRQQAEGGFKDMCHPINQRTRKYFEDVILENFNRSDSNDNDNNNGTGSISN